MFQASKAVFFGAHTDDEMICAGTLHRLVRSGCEVHVVTFAPAAIQSDRTGGQASSDVVVKEWHAALDAIGVSPFHRKFLNYTPSSNFQKFRQDICQYAYDYCEQQKPQLVFTLSPEDENTAHAVVGVETERVMRGRVPTVVRCQFPWNYGIGRPNLYVKLAQEDMIVKQRVIDAYTSQHFRYSYKDMLTHYVIGDGLSVKCQAAEKFEIVRSVL